MAKEKKEAAAGAADGEAEKISFHAAVLNHDGTYFTQEFETLDELVAYLKARVNQDVSVFAFRGTRLKISKPPMRHLLVPGQEPIPLFEAPTDFEEDETGYLGVDPINLEAPPQLKMPGAGRAPAPAGEEFYEDDDGGLNVFDSVLPDPDS
jgi:hypothetical protein